jgi:hypothetical protein
MKKRAGEKQEKGERTERGYAGQGDHQFSIWLLGGYLNKDANTFISTPMGCTSKYLAGLGHMI